MPLPLYNVPNADEDDLPLAYGGDEGSPAANDPVLQPRTASSESSECLACGRPHTSQLVRSRDRRGQPSSGVEEEVPEQRRWSFHPGCTACEHCARAASCSSESFYEGDFGEGGEGAGGRYRHRRRFGAALAFVTEKEVREMIRANNRRCIVDAVAGLGVAVIALALVHMLVSNSRSPLR